MLAAGFGVWQHGGTWPIDRFRIRLVFQTGRCFMACLRFQIAASLLVPILLAAPAAAEDKPGGKLNVPPNGFKALFNGKDLTNWKGMIGNGSPRKIREMSKADREKAQKAANARMRQHWSVKDGILVFDGKGKSLVTAKDYRNFVLYVDWKIKKKGDSGIYLRGTPQVQIWDPTENPRNAVGSGGLFNNRKNPSKPLVKADNPIGEWNTFKIKMVGQKVTVWLNGKLVVDNVTLENFWERDKPVYERGTIELQNHGNTLYFRNIYVKELPDK
jgi:3-keto-disaccharide hydrolase